MSITEIDKQYVANTYARFPIELVSGKGAILKDSDGKEYIDLGSGIAVNVFGVADDEWLNAVTTQLSTLTHTSNLYFTEPCSTLAKMLCERTGMKKAFFGNSGAEANECAIKVARRYAFDKYGDESHSTIITLKNSFHGRTIATLTATGQDGYHTHFGPFVEGFVYAEANNADDVRKLAEENNCIAIMMELVQGEGGVCKLDKEFVDEVKKIADEKGIIILTDSDAAGFKIRNFLKNIVPEDKITHAYIPDIYGKEKRKAAPSKEGKLGVEGIDNSLLEKALLSTGLFDETEKEIPDDPITAADLFETGLSGRENSADRRRELLASMGLPARLTGKNLLAVLNTFLTKEELYRKASEIFAD